MSFGIMRESRETTYGAKDFADWENSKTDTAEISKIWNNEFDKAPGAPIRTEVQPLGSHRTDRPEVTGGRPEVAPLSPFKTQYENRISSPVLAQTKFSNLTINNPKQNVFIGGQQSGNINLLNIQNTSHVVTNVTPVTTVATAQNFMFNNNYQLQRFKQHINYNAQPVNPQQPNGMRNTFIITKPPIQQVQAPIVTTRQYLGPNGQNFLPNYQNQNQNPSQHRRSRSVQQTNLHYALSDCQEQFNDLKSELKLRKHCERDNLKTEELCHQFDTMVLPELMSKLERCNEKHWKHLEVDIKLKIDKCKAARNREKKATNSFGGNRTLETATEGVTESLTDLTRCLRICRTLLWASQVPLREYPPRLGYHTGSQTGNDERNPYY